MNQFFLFSFVCMMFLASAGIANAQEPKNMMIQFDKDVYTWTDKVKITIIAHDHNKSGNTVDVIGESETAISLSTKNHVITDFLIHETGPNTGVFSRIVTISGFPHDADGNPNTGDENGNDVLGSDHVKDGAAIGDYLISDDDIITVKLSTLRNGIENASMESSVPITWNIGQIKWEKASYDDNGVANVRLVDPDMNWNPDKVENFTIDAWSDSDPAGINLIMTETGNNTGVFEGTVFFDTRESSGHRLHVIEGDTVTVEYEDNTLPHPYTTADEINIKDTTIIRNPPVFHDLLPPLKQVKNGIALIDVKCDEGKQPVHSHDSTRIACVSEETHAKLIERGWARDFSEINNALSSYMDRITPTINDFKNVISEPYNIDTIFSKFGEPHDDIGSGIHIYVYELNDKTQIWIGYVEDIWYMRHVDSEGNLIEELFAKPPERQPNAFANGATEIMSPDHESLRYTNTIQVIEAFKEKYSNVGITEFPDSKGVSYKYSSSTGVDLIIEKDRVVLKSWKNDEPLCIVTNPLPRDVWDNCPPKW